MSYHEARCKERTLGERVISEFPWAIHADYILGHDPIPRNALLFCNGTLVGLVLAYYEHPTEGWAIQVLPETSGDYMDRPLYVQRGNVRKETYSP